MDVAIESSRKEVIKEEFEKPYFQQIVERLKQEKAEGKVVYPSWKDMFRAFELTPFDQVKVVLLGQDPYHGEGQAHGLCFSVSEWVKAPPSLKNIFKEIESDVGNQRTRTDLSDWAAQGVFLLNAMLSVLANSPASHADIGWQTFTDAVISKISDLKVGVVFVLRGKFAQGKEVLIDTSKHVVLKAAHPSPFSAYSGFFGCKHFSKVNAFLREQGKGEIVW